MTGGATPRCTVRVLVMLSVLVTMSAGCGARWTDEQLASVEARAAGGGAASGGSNAGATSGSTAGTSTGGTASGGGAAASGGTAGAAGTTGDGATGATGAADGAGGAVASALPCSAPSDAPGVSDTEITIGSITSLSGPVPGLGATHAAAVQAYAEYRNATGGVCGRQLRVLMGDDTSDNGRARSVASEFQSQVLAMDFGPAIGGDGAVAILDAVQIPAFGTGVTSQLRSAATFYGVANPDLPDYDVPTPKYRWLHDSGVQTGAVVYVAQDSIRDQAHKQMRMMEAAGIQVVLEQALPLSTLSFDSAARAVANSDADLLVFIHAAGASASMARAMDETGHELMHGDYGVAYGSNFIELAGGAAEGAVSWIETLPVEDGGAVPEQAAYSQWMQQTAPDANMDPLAAWGWAGMRAFTDALENLPGPITREALLAQFANTGTFDAGGFMAPIQLGARVGSSCKIAMIVQGGTWVRLAPASGFLC